MLAGIAACLPQRGLDEITLVATEEGARSQALALGRSVPQRFCNDLPQGEDLQR